MADPKLIFACVLKAAATSIILCHNHPSMAAIPSLQDQQLNEKLKGTGNLLDKKVLYHLIICFEGYYSISDGGHL